MEKFWVNYFPTYTAKALVTRGGKIMRLLIAYFRYNNFAKISMPIHVCQSYSKTK